jgi:hypothetical protein
MQLAGFRFAQPSRAFPILPSRRGSTGRAGPRTNLVAVPQFPEMNKIMATVHGVSRNQITQPTYC